VYGEIVWSQRPDAGVKFRGVDPPKRTSSAAGSRSLSQRPESKESRTRTGFDIGAIVSCRRCDFSDLFCAVCRALRVALFPLAAVHAIVPAMALPATQAIDTNDPDHSSPTARIFHSASSDVFRMQSLQGYNDASDPWSGYAEFIRLVGGAAALLARGPWMTRRVAMTGLLAAVPALRAAAASTVEQDVGAMLMLGWSGTTIQSFSAQVLARHVAAGRVGGVFFVKENVGSLQDVQSLLRLFTATATPLIAIDHEGGAVQRLTERHGVSRLPSARSVASSLSPDRAQALYAQAGSEIARLGFTLNLGPVVDLHDPASPAIGHFGRAFDDDPVRVLAYARAFVDGFAEAGVLCAIKHFPGDGHAHGDAHHGMADGSNWSERDLAPYAQLIAAGRARLIMVGHTHIPSLEPRPVPVSLSEPVMTGLLRQRLSFNGVAITDDLDMLAVSSLMPRKEAVIKAIGAGNDLVMIRNVDSFDPELPRTVLAWVQEAIAAGKLSRTQIAQAADRVRGLRGAAKTAPFR